jgi:hypothetical protein
MKTGRVEYRCGAFKLRQRKAGLTFATALRAFMRQDPDIVMAGKFATGRRPNSQRKLH